MSVLVVGISHQSAPVEMLERVALDDAAARKLSQDLVDTEHVSETVVVSTCNRVEVYAEVDRFHAGIEDVSRLLADRAGAARDDVVPYLSVHYDEAAVAHLFRVAAGLDSMVVGESQILGQVRVALQRAQESHTVGAVLNTLFQQALRVGKRGHAETDIDRAGPSVVVAALDSVEQQVGPVANLHALVIGAGAMAALSVAALVNRGLGDLTVVNRTCERAERLVAGTGGRAVPWSQLRPALAAADLVVSGTGSTGTVVGAEDVEHALRRRPAGRPYTLVDLALPRDIDPAVAALPGVHHIALSTLVEKLEGGPVAEDVEQVRAIVGAEVAAFRTARSAARVTPTVVALRSMATEVVTSELDRLERRLPGLDPQVRAELQQSVRRVADKLLHSPTVRIKELADSPGGSHYAEALADLFRLDPAEVEAVTRADPDARPGGTA
ncbi:MAG: glutamyl-tRNA reductase [Actinomycetota bacterium]|nr:glutamyl-tRNA reductase [Actinomycetota bacterium]